MADRHGVRMRSAVMEDADLLLAWRNDPVTRQMSLQTDEVRPPDHRRWLMRSLASPERAILIAEDATTGAALGMCRFDSGAEHPACAEVSINIAPCQRGRGIGRGVLVEGISAYAAAYPDVNVLRAVVRQANTASLRLFEGAGFRRVTADSGLLYLERSLAGPEQVP